MTKSHSTIFFPSSIQKEESPVHRFVRHFDWILFFDVVFLSLIGLIMVHSASLRFNRPEIFLGKQFLAFIIGMVLLFFMATINYQIFAQYSKTIFGFSVLLLLCVILVGTTYRGTKAWLVIGPFAFQPSELSKILFILILSGWCDHHMREIKQIKTLFIAFLFTLAHVGLILLQPDFGSTLVYFPVLLGILFVAGVRLIYLSMILFYGLVCITVVLSHTLLSLSPTFLEAHHGWNYLFRAMSLGKEFFILHISLGIIFLFVWWFIKQLRFHIPAIYFICTFLLIFFGWFSSTVFSNSIKDYQRKRLVTFFNPKIDPLGTGYHVTQSVIALGSGKIFGKGLFSGTQGRLGFLPEQHTDFIFSVLGEELGFLMSIFVIFLYFVLIWRSIDIASVSRDRFGSMIAAGIGTMFAFYTMLNLTMVMGLAPVTGLPLPFLSYGGSSLVSSLIAVGILLSIHVRRYTH